MAWELRNGRSYYYAKVRLGAKVQSVYLGTCPEPFIKPKRIEERRQEDQIWQAIESNLRNLQNEIEQELAKAGLHRQNYGRWRRSRRPTT